MKRTTLLSLIVIGLILLSVLVWLSFQIVPNFSLSIMLVVISVFVYVLTENWITHAANEFENRFWSFVAFTVTFVCLFVDDSPFNLGTNYPQVGWFIVLLVCFLVHNYDRHLRRVKLKRVNTLKRVSSASVLLHRREKLHQLLAAVNSLLDGIDNVWFSSTFLNFFLLPKVLYVERSIITIFQDATPDELIYLVTNCHLGLLFYKMKDHNIWRIYNRTILLDTLAIHRIGELNVLAKACLLDGLQRMKISAHEKGEIYVKHILLKTTMDDLSDLKSTTDSKGDFYSLHKLIYEDIRDNKIRGVILDHISKQARTQRAHMHLGTSNTSKRRSQYAWRKILSDVDDTLSCSGGSYPAGLDTSYPKKALYPGVLAFYRELDLGCSGPDIWNSDRVGNLVFLSARPHVYKDALEQHSYELFQKLRKDRGLYTSPSLLAGNLVTGGEFMVAGDMEPLAQQKYLNFQQYAALYMEYDFVFVGDNGQGDVRVAELISNDNKLFSNLERAYVHEVQPLHLTHAKDRQKILTRNCSFVCYFITYVDAAIDAYQHKLIRLTGLRRIAEEAVFDFEHIPWDLFGGNTQTMDLGTTPTTGTTSTTKPSSNKSLRSTPQREKRRHSSQLQVQLKESFRKRYMRLLELNHSLTAANTILVANGLKPVQLLRFQCLFPRGTPVNTLMGYGVVEKFRYHDGFYQVRLSQGLKDDCTGGDMAYLRSDSLANANRQTSSFMGVFWTSNQGKKNKYLQKDKSKFKGPWIAWTPYGMAKLLIERPDNIGVLKTNWGATLYLHESKIVKMKEVRIETKPLLQIQPAPVPPSSSITTAPEEKKRPGFWSILFGRGPTPAPEQATSSLNPTELQQQQLQNQNQNQELQQQQQQQQSQNQPQHLQIQQEQQLFHHGCHFPHLLDNLPTLAALFEQLEEFLELSKLDYVILSSPEGVFSQVNKWIEVVTSYGKGKLVDLLVRSNFIHLKILFEWGGIGHLALNTIKSFELKNSSSELEQQPQHSHHQLQENTGGSVDEYLENVRKIRGSIQSISQTTTSPQPPVL